MNQLPKHSILRNSNTIAYGIKDLLFNTIAEMNTYPVRNIYPGTKAVVVESSEIYILDNDYRWQLWERSGCGSGAEQPTIIEPFLTLATNLIEDEEVGTVIIPQWEASLSKGSYSFGPDTGVVVESWEISDTKGNTSSEASGMFDEITMEEGGMPYQITAIAHHSQGVIAKNSAGKDSNPVQRIEAGKKTKVSVSMDPVRFMFWGYTVEDTKIDMNNINSNDIRNLSNKGLQMVDSIETDEMRQIIIATKKGMYSTVEIRNQNGTPATVKHKVDIAVEGANHYAAALYDVWYVENARADSGKNTYYITLS